MAKTLTALSLTALVALALSATSALAAPSKDPVADRQAILKGFGPPTGEAVQMMQGKLPFDLAKVQAALATYQKGAPLLPALFTPGTQMDAPGVAKTKALPAIWENKADFDGRFAKLAADSKTVAAAITDEDSFKANFKTVLGNCGGCHTTYRAKD